MSWRGKRKVGKTPINPDDLFPRDGHDVLAGLEFIVHIERRVQELETNFMAALDDLNDKLDELTTLAQNTVTLLEQLRSSQGVPEDQVAATVSKVQAILDDLAPAVQG